MPTPESMVQFKAGLQEAFNDIVSKDLNTVYFVTDTQRLFVGETEYTRPVQHGAALPEGYNPPNSLFVLETGAVRDLYYSADGASWTQIAHLPAEISGGVFGSATQVPVITVDEHGAITSVTNTNIEFPSVDTDVTVEGNDSPGNVITGVSAESRTITVTKGTMLDQTTADGRYAQLSGAAFTGDVTVPTTPAGNGSATAKTYVDTQDASTLQSAKDYADSILGANDAMLFKGTVGGAESGATVTDFSSLTDYKTGWTYRVIEAGTYAGVDCEVGDLLIAVVDYSDSFDDADWTVAQTNIDGAVVSNAALANGNIVTGAGGQNVQDSGVSLSTLQTTIGNKVDKVQGTESNIVVFGADGAIADSSTKVSDLATASSVSTLQQNVTDLQSNKVDKTTTVAGHALSSNVEIAINDLSDVEITSPAQGNGLVYDAASQTWKNGPVEADSVSWANVQGRPSITFTGDVTGTVNLSTGAPTGALTLGTVGTAGTYTKVTTDANGRVTAGEEKITTADISDMPTALPNPQALTVGEKTYNGSAAVTITADDLGITDENTTYTLGASATANVATISLTPSDGEADTFTITGSAGEVVIAGDPDALTIGIGAIAQSKVTGLDTALAGKLSSTATVAITGGATASATAFSNNAVSLNVTSLNAASLTGAIPANVTAVTASAGDNSTAIATTAFVTNAVNSSALKWGSF